MTNEQINKVNHFDKEKIFEDNCRELLDELVLLCSIHRIPFFWTAAVKNNNESTEYISDGVGIASRSIVLKEDKISKHLAINAGFDVVPHHLTQELDSFEEL